MKPRKDACYDLDCLRAHVALEKLHALATASTRSLAMWARIAEAAKHPTYSPEERLEDSDRQRTRAAIDATCAEVRSWPAWKREYGRQVYRFPGGGSVDSTQEFSIPTSKGV